MPSGRTPFFKYLATFGFLLVISFIFLLATSYFREFRGTPQTTCITSSGDPC